jgi:hypothetical protein
MSNLKIIANIFLNSKSKFLYKIKKFFNFQIFNLIINLIHKNYLIIFNKYQIS